MFFVFIIGLRLVVWTIKLCWLTTALAIWLVTALTIFTLDLCGYYNRRGVRARYPRLWRYIDPI